MELKTYQQHVMDDLSAYLTHLNQDRDMIAAWKGYWMDKDIHVGLVVCLSIKIPFPACLIFV